MSVTVNDVRVYSRDRLGRLIVNLKNRKNIPQSIGNQQTEKGSVSGVPE